MFLMEVRDRAFHVSRGKSRTNTVYNLTRYC